MLCQLDVFLLRVFISTAEKHHNPLAVPPEINPIPRTKHHAQLKYAIANGLTITKIAEA